MAHELGKGLTRLCIKADIGIVNNKDVWCIGEYAKQLHTPQFTARQQVQRLSPKAIQTQHADQFLMSNAGGHAGQTIIHQRKGGLIIPFIPTLLVISRRSIAPRIAKVLKADTQTVGPADHIGMHRSTAA